MAKGPAPRQLRDSADESSVRQRILSAAFSTFMERGYTPTSTLEIATRAHVSKRALYALVGNKREVLAACISERAKRLQPPADLPEPRDREALGRALAAFGARLVREVSDPTVIAVFRLAIAEAVRAPEIARALDSIGYETIRAALREIMTRARSAGLLGADPAEMAEHFSGLLWGSLTVRLLLRIADRPGPREVTRRARAAASAFLQLYPSPDDAEAARQP